MSRPISLPCPARGCGREAPRRIKKSNHRDPRVYECDCGFYFTEKMRESIVQFIEYDRFYGAQRAKFMSSVERFDWFLNHNHTPFNVSSAIFLIRDLLSEANLISDRRIEVQAAFISIWLLNHKSLRHRENEAMITKAAIDIVIFVKKRLTDDDFMHDMKELNMPDPIGVMQCMMRSFKMAFFDGNYLDLQSVEIKKQRLRAEIESNGKRRRNSLEFGIYEAHMYCYRNEDD